MERESNRGWSGLSNMLRGDSRRRALRNDERCMVGAPCRFRCGVLVIRGTSSVNFDPFPEC